MKKILITAASFAVLTTGVAAHADHNYVGLGLGWTFSRANMKESTGVTGNGAIRSADIKSKAKDNALVGKISLGRAFDQGSVTWLTEMNIGLDSSKTETRSSKNYSLAPAGSMNGTTTTSLRRRCFFGLTGGISTNILPDTSLHGKLSVLLAQFKMQTKTDYQVATTGAGGLLATAGAVNFAQNISPNYSTKNRMKWGFGVSLGASKALTNSLSLGLDYSFELFQKVKLNKSRSDAPYNGSMNPQYHSVILTLTQKI